MEVDKEFIERLHLRIDSTHDLINKVNLLYTEQKQDIKHLSEDINKFIEKVDKSIFNTEEGFIIKTKTKLSNLCVQIKNQWYLITLLLVGIFGIAWEVIRRK